MFWENIKEAFSNILSNKMRSILTMLGIIIGISAVILITTIGSSINATLNATMNTLGGNTLTCYLDAKMPEDPEELEDWEYPDLNEEYYITDDMINELMEKYPNDIIGIAAQNQLGSANIREDEEHYANVNVMGATDAYLSYLNLDMIAGRTISKTDNKKKKTVCMIADRMAKYYFGDQDPIGQQIDLDMDSGKTITAVVIGVYKYSAAIMGGEDNTVSEKDRSTIVFLPYNTTMKTTGQDTLSYSSFDLIVNNQSDQKVVMNNVQSFFDEKYSNNKDWQVSIFSLSSMMDIVNVVISVITAAISAIAAISLVVGGVGVMNIMLVSITERTREIGIRKALGAKNSVIRMQFVVEAIVLCLIGGVIGIILGLLGGYLIGFLADFVVSNFYADYAKYIIVSVHPSITAIFLSVFFSMLTGVFFGYYPANKAARMEVIDALRYE